MKKLLLNIFLLFASQLIFSQNEALITSSLDNTLYFSSEGSISNGSGEHIFAGVTRLGESRRALISFDIASSIPAGSLIDSVSLTLHVSLAPNISAAHEFSLHRVLAAWDEGASDAGQPGGLGTDVLAGDATWIHRIFPDSLWAEEGGDFVETASATIDVPAVRDIFVTWSSPEMIADVQGWLDDTTTNFGWLILGDENDTQTARRFDSREVTDENVRPALYIRYTQSVSVEPVLGLNRFETYPNPAIQQLNINLDLNQPQDISIQVLNLIGQPVLRAQYSAGSTSIQHVFDVRNLNPGLYFVRIHTDGGVSTRKIVVER